MGFEQNKLIMSPFIKSQFSYCLLISMFGSRTSMNKLNNIHKKCLRSNFNKLLESSHELSVHKTCINYLTIEVYKYLHGLSPKLILTFLLFRKILTTFAIFVYLALKIHGQCVLEWMQQRFVLASCDKKFPQQKKILHHQKVSKNK